MYIISIVKHCLMGLFLVCASISMNAQETANPIAHFYSISETSDVELTAGESQTAQAPLSVTFNANVETPRDYNYICEWRIWPSDKTEKEPLVTRFEENTSYTFTSSGGYKCKLYVTFTKDNDTIDISFDPITIVISESKLTCPDGFSPNGDGINDFFRATAQSIVKLDAKFFNRRGQLVHSVTINDVEHAEDDPNKIILWDGKQNGNVVKNGVYFLNLQAEGSDGVVYKIKKAVNIMTGYNRNTESARE